MHACASAGEGPQASIPLPRLGDTGGISSTMSGGLGMSSTASGLRPGTAGAGAAASAARVSQLEASIRRLESQLAGERAKIAQYEERLVSKNSDMDTLRERMSGKEHAQFNEIKRLRTQLAEATSALSSERTDAAARIDDARRRADEESTRLLTDAETLRSQLALVSGSVAAVVAKQGAAAVAERRQKEKLKAESECMLREQAARASEEHRNAVENLKQQSTFFLQKQGTQLGAAQAQLESVKATHAAQLTALNAELDYLAVYAERVTEVVRRMESGVVPVHDRAGGIKAFRLPPREQPPAIDGSRLAVLRARSSELTERLQALSASPASGAAAIGTAGGAAGSGFGTGTPRGLAIRAGGVWGQNSTLGVTSSAGGAGGGGVLSNADVASLKTQWEAEMRATIAAQVLADMKSEQTVEYIRSLEAQVARYRNEVQAEKKKSNEVTVALRSVQRAQTQPQSGVNKAIAAFTPAGTLTRSPTWGMGHTRPSTAHPAGLAHSMRSSGTGASMMGLGTPTAGRALRASQSLQQQRPSTASASAHGALTSSWTEQVGEAPQ